MEDEIKRLVLSELPIVTRNIVVFLIQTSYFNFLGLISKYFSHSFQHRHEKRALDDIFLRETDQLGLNKLTIIRIELCEYLCNFSSHLKTSRISSPWRRNNEM